MKVRFFYCVILLLMLLPLAQALGQDSPGDVWLVPDSGEAYFNTTYSTEIHVNTGTQLVSALGLDIHFDPGIVQYLSASGMITQPPYDDFYQVALAPENPGTINISGFDVTGLGPGEDLILLTINWKPLSQGMTDIDLVINSLVDSSYQDVGTPRAIPGTITVSGVLLGDIDQNGELTIVDALMLAQYQVGIINPFFPVSDFIADVNGDGAVNIVDALMVAQFYVGLISTFR